MLGTAKGLPGNHFRSITQHKCHVDTRHLPIAAVAVRTWSIESSVLHKSIFNQTTAILDDYPSTSTGRLDGVLVDDRFVALPVRMYVPLAILHLSRYLRPSSLPEHPHHSCFKISVIPMTRNQSFHSQQSEAAPTRDRSIFPRCTNRVPTERLHHEHSKNTTTHNYARLNHFNGPMHRVIL